MAEPTTVNTGLIIPNTGDLPGTWGSNALNPDFIALDGYFGGVQTISVSNAPVTLTSPAGFTPTPSGGPTQAQNAILRFTGAQTANVQVLLPLPAFYIVENLTTGNFYLSFRAAGTGEVICVDQGERQHIFNDGLNVRFADLGRIGEITIWAGLNSMPAWVTASTVPPYLLCDGAIYNFSTYPYLGKRLGSAFGGNGVTTFGVPDLRGRVPLPYDGTGSRITAGGSGLSGTTIGATLDQQIITLTAAQIPSITSGGPNNITVNSTVSDVQRSTFGTTSLNAATGGSLGAFASSGGNQTGTITSNGSNSISVTSTNTGGSFHNNVQPSQVTGIAVIRAA